MKENKNVKWVERRKILTWQVALPKDLSTKYPEYIANKTSSMEKNETFLIVFFPGQLILDPIL